MYSEALARSDRDASLVDNKDRVSQHMSMSSKLRSICNKN
jgi:hypothetical protein